MTLGAAIDVALGLPLTYLLVGLIATAAQELVAGLLSWRAEMLHRKIEQIIGDPALVSEFNEHPIIAALRGADGKPPSYIPPAIFATAVQAIATAGRSVDTPRAMFEAIRSWAVNDGSPLARAVFALGQDAAGDPDRLRAGLIQWYAGAMDRLSGVYKRRASICSLAFGILLAIALNVDTLRLLSTLANDPYQRASVVEKVIEAGRAVQQDMPLPLDDSAPVLPIGWRGAFAVGLNDLPLAIVGWLLTGLAASLGAAFWFDLLGRLVNLRLAGPRPAAPPGAVVAQPALALEAGPLSRARPAGSD